MQVLLEVPRMKMLFLKLYSSPIQDTIEKYFKIVSYFKIRNLSFFGELCSLHSRHGDVAFILYAGSVADAVLLHPLPLLRMVIQPYLLLSSLPGLRKKKTKVRGV